MPTAAILSKQPPFPTDIPLYDVAKLSYPSLLAGDVTESRKLFEACKETGFFLLDLRDTPQGERLLKEAEGMLELTRKFSALEEAEKAKFPSQRSGLVGWQPFKDNLGNSEFYSIGQDSITGVAAAQPHPRPVAESAPLIKMFAKNANVVAMDILSMLDHHLKLPSGTLESRHLPSRPSKTTVRLIHMPPRPASALQKASLFGHTDNGSLTILFNVIGGLQILPPHLPDEEKNWCWLRPEPGCAIVNLGDAMVQWSGGVLHSNLHRVVTPPGQQAWSERHSFAYVMKPDQEASMRPLCSGDEVSDANEDDGYKYGDWLSVKMVSSWRGKNSVRVGDRRILRARL